MSGSDLEEGDVIVTYRNMPYRPLDANPDWQENPWTRLSLYQSRDLLSDGYKKRHGSALDMAKCREIVSHLVQGEQYFGVAGSAGSLAKPLLLYYGAVALARAMVLFAEPDKREIDLESSHGIRASWSKRLRADDALAALTSLPLVFQPGTFSELASATQNAEWTQIDWVDERAEFGLQAVEGKANGAYGWLAAGAREYAKGQSVTFGDVVSRIPDLAFLYESTISKRANCFPVQMTALVRARNMAPSVPTARAVRVTLMPNRLPLPEPRPFKSAMHLATEWAWLGTTAMGRATLRADVPTHTYLPIVMPPVRLNRRWASYFVAPFPGGHVLSTLSMLYLVAFAVGTLVRYYPTAWRSLSMLETGDRAAPLIAEAVKLVQIAYPTEVADFFERMVDVGVVNDLPVL